MARFNEDAGCANPCGEEPMGCSGCPERGNTGPAHVKAYYSERLDKMSPEEYDEWYVFGDSD
jgi:hypothetical protein